MEMYVHVRNDKHMDRLFMAFLRKESKEELEWMKLERGTTKPAPENSQKKPSPRTK